MAAMAASGGVLTWQVIAAMTETSTLARTTIRTGLNAMYQIVAPPVISSRRWWVLAIVVAAQFMFGVDAFIVNVAIPTIAAELHASPAQIEAVIAIYLIACATLVVTGGRLGDIHGTKDAFIAGVAGFSASSLWCGLAQSGPELTIARLMQGATAALMVPQVLGRCICCLPTPCVRALSPFTVSCWASLGPPDSCLVEYW
jgi:MFS family permease